MVPVTIGYFEGWRLFGRLLLLQGLLHAKGMQNLGLMHALSPALLRMAGKNADNQLLLKHLDFFNCNPNFTPLVAGGILRLERERLDGGTVSDDDIAFFKRSLSSPLAAMGDLFFLGGLKPLALTLACIFAIYNSFIGLLAVLLLYNVIVVSCRLWGVYFGYSKGWELVDVFSGPSFQRVLGIVQSIAASVGGALVAVILYRFPRDESWSLALAIAIAVMAVISLRRDLSSARFAIILFPICVLIALIVR